MGKDSLTRFNEWSSTYEESFFWRRYFTPLHDLVERKVGPVDGSSVLDVGCGTGDMLRRLERSGAKKLVGVDESEGMLKVARELSSEQPRIEYALASAESIPLPDEQFGVVISCVAFHHFPDPVASLREAARVMTPDGRLYLCDLTGRGAAGRLFLTFGRIERSDDHYFDIESLTRLAGEADLVVREAEVVVRFPPTMLLIASKPGPSAKT